MEFSFSSLRGPENVSRFSVVQQGKTDSEENRSVYNLKSSFFGWLVCSLKSSVNKPYRERMVKERVAALSAFKNSDQMRQVIATLQFRGKGAFVEDQLRNLEKDAGQGRKFFRGTQELVRSLDLDPVVQTAGKRSEWTERTTALTADNADRYTKIGLHSNVCRPDHLRSDGYINRPLRSNVCGPDPKKDKELGRAALDYMTETIMTDKVVVGTEALGDLENCEDAGKKKEARERALLAMSFLKFLTVEPHTEESKTLFRWEKTTGIEDNCRLRYQKGTEANQEQKPVESPRVGLGTGEAAAPDFEEVLVPDKELQKYVVALLDKCVYEEERGVLVDFRLFDPDLQEHSLAEEPVVEQPTLSREQQIWVGGQLGRFLH